MRVANQRGASWAILVGGALVALYASSLIPAMSAYVVWVVAISVCLIWHAEFRDWTACSSARVVAAGLVNNPLVQPLVLPWLQRKFGADARG